MNQQWTRADGSALDEQEQAILLNARNFEYFCNMVELKTCAFCSIDTILNVVSAENETWRMWPCPPKFQAKDLAVHEVMAPKRHTRHFGNLNSEEHDDFVSLFLKNIVPQLSGEPLVLSLGPEYPILKQQVHAEFIVPDRTCRVQAVFSQDIVPDTSFTERYLHLKEQGKWKCGYYPIPLPGIAERYVIYCKKGLPDSSNLEKSDYRDLFHLFSFLTEGELGYNVGPGTFLLALPGAAFSMRCGDIAYTAASQLHLHGNYKRPINPEGMVSETLAKDPKDIALKQRIVEVWWNMLLYMRSHEGAEEKEALATLEPDERELLASRK